MKLDLDLDDMLEGFTRDGMKRFVKKLLSASATEEKAMLAKLNGKPAKNDHADLDEEMHGKPNTPMVLDEEDALDEDSSPADDLPIKKKGKK